ncbi:MAG: radical SAM protein [Clostridia bacterium]|nr:radical SAM protein [Clostridia bacterium]
MGIKNKIAQYKEWKSGVKHCTFNPDGPGVVRIHLVPPKFNLFKNAPYIVILNGYYLLPLGYSWAILLSGFIEEVNLFDGKEMSESDVSSVFENTLEKTRHVYSHIPKDVLREDLEEILDIIFEIAQGGNVDAEIEKLSIRTYAGRMSAPHRMDLMVSAMTDECGKWKCNQKCLFCYAAGQEYAKVRELSTGEWKTAIDKLRAAGVPMLTFTGGEPTQRADIAELVEHAKWFITRLNTNGVNVTKELAAALKKAGLDSMQVTLYSHDEETHNSLVGSAHFADTVAGIRNAVAAGLDISVNTPLCRKNADYAKTLEFVHSLGVRFVTASGLICTGTASANHENYDLTEDELYGAVSAAKAFCDAHGMEMDFTSPGLIAKEKLENLGLNVPMCGASLSNMAVAPDGTVVPCQSWLAEGAGLGNILTDPFARIWKHKTALALRKMSEEEALSCPFRTGLGKEKNNGK